jgi:hypothetical protein
MARKTTGITTPRKRKTAVPAEPVAVQAAPVPASPETPKSVLGTRVSAKRLQANLDEEIRLRAYELYLQRNGAAGDPNREWLIAEREVRSRYSGQQKLSALAAAQGRS